MFFGPCNDSDKLRARCDCERQATGNQENDILTDAFRCPKSAAPGFDHYATGTLPFKAFRLLILSLSLCPGCKGLGLAWVAAKLQLRKNKFSGSKKLCFLHCSYDMKLREAGLCKKNIFFSGSRKLFFPHCSCEAQRSPAFQKSNFSGSKKMFFSALLL